MENPLHAAVQHVVGSYMSWRSRPGAFTHPSADDQAILKKNAWCVGEHKEPIRLPPKPFPQVDPAILTERCDGFSCGAIQSIKPMTSGDEDTTVLIIFLRCPVNQATIDSHRVLAFEGIK